MREKTKVLALFACIVFAALAGILTACSSPNLLSADLIVINGNVVTVDDRSPRAEAVAVHDGKILAVGKTSRITQLAGEQTRVIDAGGKTITPGFIDAHCHPRPIYPPESPLAVVDLRPESVSSIDELIDALRRKATLTPKGQWVRGVRYQDTKLGRHPTRRDLDRVSTEQPIYIGHSSGHLAAVNSKALEMAKITKATPDPPGGAFDRDPSGEPTGVCRESARDLVLRQGPPIPQATQEEQVTGLIRCFQQFLSKGITGVHDASAPRDKIGLYQDALEAGQPVRVYMMVRGGDRWGISTILRDFKKLNLRTGFGNDRLRIGAVKIVHGNSLSGRTCWLYEPYADRPEYYGIPPGRSQRELDELIHEIHEAGFQAAVHSNGDREIDMVLDAFEKALDRLPKQNHRHRIEHASVANPGILQRVKKLGLGLALHSYVYEHGDKMEAYGEKRWDMMHPNRSALDLGIPVAGNSDYGVSAADPLLRIQSMVTRKSAEGKVYGPEQRVSVEQAIRVWTLGSAYASFEEDIKGSIEAGKLADFVILSDDPTKVPPDTIKDIQVEKTIIGGEVTYERVQ